jgi:hypothetical protein
MFAFSVDEHVFELKGGFTPTSRDDGFHARRLTIADAPAIHTKSCRAMSTSLSGVEPFRDKFRLCSHRSAKSGRRHLFCRAVMLRKVGQIQLFDERIGRILMNEG